MNVLVPWTVIDLDNGGPFPGNKDNEPIDVFCLCTRNTTFFVCDAHSNDNKFYEDITDYNITDAVVAWILRDEYLSLIANAYKNRVAM